MYACKAILSNPDGTWIFIDDLGERSCSILNAKFIYDKST